MPEKFSLMIPAQPVTYDALTNDANDQLKKIRRWTVFFMVFLILSGLTAFPVQTEIRLLMKIQSWLPGMMQYWLLTIYSAIENVSADYPFLLYGYDWLAYAHIVIALFFYGVYRNPLRNEWVLRIGMLACAGIFPLAMICGQIRGIPFFWTMIDCSFGLFGLIPLLIIRRQIKRLEQITFHS